jgi:hypothetical protein
MSVLELVNGSLKQIDIDDNLVCGITPANEIYCSENISNPSWTKRTTGVLKQISISENKAVGISPSNNILYSKNYNTGPWTKLSSNKLFTQVDYDSNIACAIGDDKFVYCTDDLDLSSNNPTWLKLFGNNFNHVSVSNGKLYAVNSANQIYYSNNYSNTNSTLIPGSLKKVSFDNDTVCGIDISDNIVCATANITNPIWKKVDTKQYTDLSIRDDNLYAIDSTNKIYKFDKYKSITIDQPLSQSINQNINNSVTINNQTNTSNQVTLNNQTLSIGLYCIGKNLESQTCIDYCNRPTVNCDPPLLNYCIINPTSSICPCFRSNEFYWNVRKSISGSYNGILNNSNGYCYFNPCRNSYIRPFSYKNNPQLCDDNSSCFNYDINKVDINGNITDTIKFISNNQFCNSVSPKLSQKTVKNTNVSIGFIIFLIIIFIGVVSYFVFRKRRSLPRRPNE